MMYAYILVVFLSTSIRGDSGISAASVEFLTKETCMSAGNALVKQAEDRGAYISAWGCFKK